MMVMVLVGYSAARDRLTRARTEDEKIQHDAYSVFSLLHLRFLGLVTSGNVTDSFVLAARSIARVTSNVLSPSSGRGRMQGRPVER